MTLSPSPPDDVVIAQRTLHDGNLLLWLPQQQPRKSNERVLRRTPSGKPIITKSDKALTWVSRIAATMPDFAKVATGSKESPVMVEFWAFYRTRNSDLSVELALDALEKAGVLSNDRYVFGYSAHKIINRDFQGVLVEISQMNEEGIQRTARKTLNRLLL